MGIGGKSIMELIYLVILFLGLIGGQPVKVNCQAFNGFDNDSQDPVVGGYYKPGVTAAQILRARGYLAEEFLFQTEDNYSLSICRGRNPLINNGQGGLADKEPIVFIHGILTSAAFWVINSDGAEPRDFTRIQVNASSKEQLIELIGDDPGTFALPIMFMNFGHEVWILNRRGTLESETRVGSENRTLLDAFQAILPSLIGGGVGPNAGLGVFDFDRPNISSNFLSGRYGGFNLNGQQQQQMSSILNGEQFEKFMDGFSSLNTNSMRNLNPLRGLALGRSSISEFLQPFINLPGALVDFGKLMERFIRTFDPEFWSFSLDEQAKYDVTGAIDFVLEKSGRPQVTIIGHSAGCALSLLKLAEDPDYAEKVSKAVFLAAGFPYGEGDNYQILQLIAPFAQSYLGGFPLPFMSQQLQALLQVLCASEATQYTICEAISDTLFGFAGGQEPITPAFLANALQPTSSRELFHLSQFAASKKPRKFNFNTPDENLKVYGTIEPPIYDLGRVKLDKMSFYAGKTDYLISVGDVRTVVSQLSVPYRFNIIGEGDFGVFFNHIGYFVHKNLNVLSSIPVLMDVEHFLQ